MDLSMDRNYEKLTPLYHSLIYQLAYCFIALINIGIN